MAIHVLPINDLIEHEETSTCPCRPKVEMENGEMIVIHNAMDNREIVEQAEAIINDASQEGG